MTEPDRYKCVGNFDAFGKPCLFATGRKKDLARHIKAHSSAVRNAGLGRRGKLGKNTALFISDKNPKAVPTMASTSSQSVPPNATTTNESSTAACSRSTTMALKCSQENIENMKKQGLVTVENNRNKLTQKGREKFEEFKLASSASQSAPGEISRMPTAPINTSTHEHNF